MLVATEVANTIETILKGEDLYKKYFDQLESKSVQEHVDFFKSTDLYGKFSVCIKALDWFVDKDLQDFVKKCEDSSDFITILKVIKILNRKNASAEKETAKALIEELIS